MPALARVVAVLFVEGRPVQMDEDERVQDGMRLVPVDVPAGQEPWVSWSLVSWRRASPESALRQPGDRPAAPEEGAAQGEVLSPRAVPVPPAERVEASAQPTAQVALAAG